MYQLSPEGKKINVELNYKEEYVAPVFQTPSPTSEKKEGSNKMMLYIALLIGLVVVSGSGFLLYKHLQKKKGKTVGYQIA